MTINWGELMENSGGAFEPLPKGSYDVIVHSAEDTKSSTDKTMFKVVFKVEGGPHNGRNIYHNIVLTVDNPMALRMFFLNMKAFGLEKEFFAQNPLPSQVAAAMIGQRCIVNVDHRVYQGQTRENVKSLAPRQGIMGGVGTAPNIGVGPSIVPGVSPTSSVGASPLTPQMTPSAAPVVSQPAPTPTPSIVPTPMPTPQESTIPIPPPANPVPPEQPPAEIAGAETVDHSLVSEPGNGATDTPGLPPGMTPEMFKQFQAFQAAQQDAGKKEPANAPTGAPPFPLGEAF